METKQQKYKRGINTKKECKNISEEKWRENIEGIDMVDKTNRNKNFKEEV